MYLWKSSKFPLAIASRGTPFFLNPVMGVEWWSEFLPSLIRFPLCLLHICIWADLAPSTRSIKNLLCVIFWKKFREGLGGWRDSPATLRLWEWVWNFSALSGPTRSTCSEAPKLAIFDSYSGRCHLKERLWKQNLDAALWSQFQILAVGWVWWAWHILYLWFQAPSKGGKLAIYCRLTVIGQII